jgi:hypothetical protein
MNDQQQPLHKVRIGEGMGRSIFPTFNVNAPMPPGTPVPPQVVIPPGGGQSGTAAGTDSANSPQLLPRPANR